MKKTFLHITFAFILTLSWKSGIAQLVPVYSQYLVNQTIINPAYAGANDCLNINALYRQQWAGYEGAPSTRTLSAHSPLKNRAVALGLNLVNDVI
ncbi:MAG: type IX secretion system membrane protein PorP/SprF, partial [Opitutaceae bacterium]|nr:type IX secretion system membrane protein PorP/SprF [Cytophagales bacterium]